MKPLLIPVIPAEHVATIIQKMAGSCNAYVFGYRTATFSKKCFMWNPYNLQKESHHFDVVVFSKKDFPKGGGGVNIANAIAERSGKRITTSVLLHSVTDLGTKQPSQQWFFEQVLRSGQQLCLDPLNTPYLSFDCPAVKDVIGDKAYWLKCVAVAKFHIETAAESKHLEVTLCKITLLHTAVVQIALGLIRVYLGYTPKETNMRSLLLLCGNFTELPVKLFSQSARRFNMLCAPPSMLQHWKRLDASERDFSWLLEACWVFLDESTVLVEGGENGQWSGSVCDI